MGNSPGLAICLSVIAGQFLILVSRGILSATAAKMRSQGGAQLAGTASEDAQ
jgi:hypothetical protein